jgi:hypothetical protein
MKTVVKLSVLMIVVALAIGPAVPASAKATPNSPDPQRLGVDERCKSYWGAKFCSKLEWGSANGGYMKMCGKLPGLPYVCKSIVSNGCLDMGAGLKLQLCTNNFKKTSHRFSFDFKVKACVSVKWIGSKCGTLWQYPVWVTW